jgi:hypothetical protein
LVTEIGTDRIWGKVQTFWIMYDIVYVKKLIGIDVKILKMERK